MGKHREEQDCSICDGKGEIVITHDGTKETRTCTTCHGTGKI